MALFCLNMLEIALLLAEHDRRPTRTWRRSSSSTSPTSPTAIHDRGLWDEEDGFYYDVLRMGDDAASRCASARWSGCCRCAPSTTLGPATLDRLPEFAAQLDWFVEHKPQFARHVDHRHVRDGSEGPAARHRRPRSARPRILARLLDEDEFLSPHGVRSLSARHRDAPVHRRPRRHASSASTTTPAEATTGLFGGNSNWRGPVWFPVNPSSSRRCARYGRFFGDDLARRAPDRVRAAG